MRFPRRVRFWIMAGVLALASAGPLAASGKLEFGLHYGSWSLNVLKGPVERLVGDKMSEGFLEKIRDNTPGFEQTAFDKSVTFDSSGSNFGFDLRWFPGGAGGSFSLGLSVERTTIKVGLTNISASLQGYDAATKLSGSLTASAHGAMEIKPLSFHLNFRWELWPLARFHPYISFGLGLGLADAWDTGTLNYGYAADFAIPNKPAEHYEESATKTFRQLEEEDKYDDNGQPKTDPFTLPGVFPFVQLNLGFRFRITPGVYALVDYGFLDGFLLRGGIAIRL